MADSSYIWVIALLGYFAIEDRLPITTTTEYTEAKRCVLRVSDNVGYDSKTERPIRRDSEGKWQWYPAPEPSDLTCHTVNARRTYYRIYGEVGKVAVRIVDNENNRSFVDYTDCIISDASNWRCRGDLGYVEMSDGVLDKAHHTNWWMWQLNWLLEQVRSTNQSHWYQDE